MARNTTTKKFILIDASIKSIASLELNPSLRSLTLNSNLIGKIAHLEMMYNLTMLDLSCNRIREIGNGLSTLRSLKSLNLASNLIVKVEGLEELTSLMTINLSYNFITDLSGFEELSKKINSLEAIELHGNSLTSIEHVCESLSGLIRLHRLILSTPTFDGETGVKMIMSGSRENSICRREDYFTSICTAIPSLKSLDNKDTRTDLPLSLNDLAVMKLNDELVDSDIQSVLNQISSDELEMLRQGQPGLSKLKLFTPNIDKALEKFRLQKNMNTLKNETSSLDSSSPSLDVDYDELHLGEKSETVTTTKAIDKRIDVIEQALLKLIDSTTAQATTPHPSTSLPSHSLPPRPSKKPLVASSIKNNTVTAVDAVPSRDTDPIKESDISGEEGDNSQNLPRHIRQQQRKIRKKSPESQKRPSSFRSATVSSYLKSRDVPDLPQSSSTTEEVMQRLRSDRDRMPHVTTTLSQDERTRSSIQATYEQILHELDTEKERRIKAEMSVTQLSKELTKAKETLAENQTFKIGKNEQIDKLKQDFNKVDEELMEMRKELNAKRIEEKELLKTIKELSDVNSELEKAKLQESTTAIKRMQMLQMKVSAIQRELELQRNESRNLEDKLRQLQELMITREQEHRRDMDGRILIDSSDFRVKVREELERSDKMWEKQIQMKDEMILEKDKRYKALEDEFRSGLKLEADRFNALQKIHSQLKEDTTAKDQSLKDFEERYEKNLNLITNLNAMIKEQKSKIDTLTKAKQDQLTSAKERIDQLETQLNTITTENTSVKKLTMENSRLQKALKATEGLLDGLKVEKRLWSNELARQGAALAQDRGRLEGRIDTLEIEMNTVKKELERETDTVRIKTKIIADQTDTIAKLKEGLLERDSVIKDLRQQIVGLEKNVDDVKRHDNETVDKLHDELEHTKRRKEELKIQLADCSSQLSDAEKAYNVLNNKWTEKSKFLSDLESQISKMQEAFLRTKESLEKERNSAQKEVDKLTLRLRTVDDGFRVQLEALETSWKRKLNEVERKSEQEREENAAKIRQVEDEMRILLQEKEREKVEMKEKIAKLSNVFKEITNNVESKDMMKC